MSLALEPITASLFAAKVGAMEVILLSCVLLLLCPGIGTLPQGGEPYSWQRPVPGWRQAEETVTLELSLIHI